jgi:hypothetical protein
MLIASMEDIEQYSIDNDCPTYQAAANLNSPAVKNALYWPEPIQATLVDAVKIKVDLPGGEFDFLSNFSRSIAATIKFPVNTCYLHMLGCIASVMTKSFSFEYQNETKAVNLYVVTAQPPSTGKSGVNSILTDPIIQAYDSINDENKVTRKKLIREVALCERELNSKKQLDIDVESEIFDRMDRAEEALKNLPLWVPIIDDATIEAAEDLAGSQTGMFNIVSAESESLSVVTGSVYGDDKTSKSANFGLLLKGWDNERVTSVRITRKGHNGYVRASIAVIAQQESVETILRTAQSGRGLAERFLLLSEDNLLGKRDHSVSVPLREDLQQIYNRMIHNIAREKFVKLKFDKSCHELINNYRSTIEQNIGDGGKYEHNLLTGFMGKADKQILKLSSVIHVSENWQDGGKRSVNVSDDSVIQAIYLFEQLSKTYINAADFMGFVGTKSEALKASEYLEGKAVKGILKLRITQMINDLRNVKPFKGSRKVSDKIKNETLPFLETINYCCVVNNTIYINPRLK